MANRRPATPVALRIPALQSLPQPADNNLDSEQPSSLHNVSPAAATVVADRLGPADSDVTSPARADLHIALLIDDLKHWTDIKNSAYLISPPLWDGNVKLHVILRNPKVEAQDMVYRVALTQLGLMDPKVALLAPDTQIDLGWPTEEQP